MEQHSIIEELLSLQREVQSLKFLNGGAISDLVSRVRNIENTLKTKHSTETKAGYDVYRQSNGVISTSPSNIERVDNGIRFPVAENSLYVVSITATSTTAETDDSPRIRVNLYTVAMANRRIKQYDYSSVIVKPGDFIEILYALPDDDIVIRGYPFETIM